VGGKDLRPGYSGPAPPRLEVRVIGHSQHGNLGAIQAVAGIETLGLQRRHGEGGRLDVKTRGS